MTRIHYASTKDSDLLYLLGHQIGDPFFYLAYDGNAFVFLGATDIDAFVDSGSSGVTAAPLEPLLAQAREMEGDVLSNLAKVILEQHEGHSEISVPASFPLALADSLRASGVTIHIDTPWCPERVVKSEKEIAAMRDNFKKTEKAYVYIEEALQRSTIVDNTLIYNDAVLTSEWLRREVSKLLLDEDLISPEGMIISCGAHAAMPHHAGAGPLRPNQTIVVDVFPQSSTNFYFSDMTRTYVKGVASERVAEMYHAVAAAQEASLAALAPGASTKDVYEISAKVIRDAGFDVGEKGYVHSLGHGVGIDIHEAPTLGPRSDTVLQPGHVITIEPGLYYKEHGGVRIEDTVVITEDGYERLSHHPQNWLIS